MKSMIVIKGPSGVGKGTRVVQVVEFLRQYFEPVSLTYQDGKKTKPLGLAFEEMGLLFIGQYTTSNKSGLASWSSMDAIHSGLGSGELARDMLRGYVDMGYTLVCEGEPLMLSDKWRPEYMFKFYGLDTLSLLYFHYKDRAEYDARIIGRSGKAAGDSAWSRNESYPKEFNEKSLKEMQNVLPEARVQFSKTESGETYLFGERGRLSEMTLLPHDADLACVGRAIFFQLVQNNHLSELRTKCLPLTPGDAFRRYCKNHPMLRSVDGPNPLVYRIPVKAKVMPEVKPRTNSILRHLGK